MENDGSPAEASLLQVDLLQKEMRDGVDDAQIRRGEAQQFKVIIVHKAAYGRQQDVQGDPVHAIEIHAHPLRQSAHGVLPDFILRPRAISVAVCTSDRHDSSAERDLDGDASLFDGHFTQRLAGDTLRPHEAADLTERIFYMLCYSKETHEQERNKKRDRTHQQMALRHFWNRVWVQHLHVRLYLWKLRSGTPRRVISLVIRKDEA